MNPEVVQVPPTLQPQIPASGGVFGGAEDHELGKSGFGRIMEHITSRRNVTELETVFFLLYFGLKKDLGAMEAPHKC